MHSGVVSESPPSRLRVASESQQVSRIHHLPLLSIHSLVSESPAHRPRFHCQSHVQVTHCPCMFRLPMGACMSSLPIGRTLGCHTSRLPMGACSPQGEGAAGAAAHEHCSRRCGVAGSPGSPVAQVTDPNQGRPYQSRRAQPHMRLPPRPCSSWPPAHKARGMQVTVPMELTVPAS
jgi:hypothetical protein